MIISIHDFPLKIEGNLILNNKKEVKIDLSKASKELLIQFIKENIPCINDGKRVYRKRLTKTLSFYTLEEAIDIIKTEMFEKGYILCSKKQHEIEYNIIYKDKQHKKIYFNKIILNMEETKSQIQKHLQNVLFQIIDAKKEANLTPANKEIAIKDLIKFLNLYCINAIKNKEAVLKGLFNQHQEIWFYALNKVLKESKYPLLNITNGLWRYYIITIFKSNNQESLLKELTGWSTDMLNDGKVTYDTKILLLSINEILSNKE